MPPLAASKRPGRSWVAPVNDAAGVAEELGFEQRLGHRAAVDGHEGPGRAGRFVVNHARDALLADAALAGDEHRRVDLRDAARQVEHALHRRAVRAQARGVAHAGGHLGAQRLATRAQRALDPLQLLGDLRQRRLHARLLVEGQVIGERLAPFVDRPADHTAYRVALAAAAFLHAVDVPAVGAGEVAAGKAGERPAHGLLGAPEVQQVLLGLVAVLPDRERNRLGAVARIPGGRLDAHQTLQRVQPSAGALPVVLAVPRKAVLERIGGAPAVGVAEPGQHRPSRREPERVDQLAPQQAHRHRVEQQGSLVGEADDAALGVELEQLAEVEISGAHAIIIRLVLIDVDYHFDCQIDRGNP